MRRLVEGHPLDIGGSNDSPVIGVEHEYRVLDGDTQLDFATLLHGLAVDGARLDPTDPNAYRTRWGGLVTADGREAEVATAPVLLQPDCTSELEWRTVVARRTLASILPGSLRLDGYSTHLNLEIDDDDVVGAGRLFVRHFAPAMMLLLDRRTSPGLLVRPRCGRLEIGGEYCHGVQLRAAATFAAAGGLACGAATRSRDVRRHLPRPVRARVRPSNIRAGWYVDRRAFGVDLYEHGRGTPLSWDGRSLTAQDHLVEAWERSRGIVEPLLARDELFVVDRVVDGALPLPLEAEPAVQEPIGPFIETAFGRALAPRARPGYLVEPVSIAWEAVAFRLRGRRDAIACIPRGSLAEFLDDLDAGRLDAAIGAFLGSAPQGRVLRVAAQTSTPGLFDELASPGAIAPAERLPGRPRRSGSGAGTPRDSRRNKRREARGPRRVLIAAGAAAIVVIAVAAVAVANSVRSNKVTAGGAAAVGAKFDFQFKVVSTKAGPHFTGSVPAVGSTTSLAVDANCQTTCSFLLDSIPNGAVPFANLGLPLAGSGDHLTGSRDSSRNAPGCNATNAVHQELSLDVRRDAQGKVTGFSGSYVLVHPGGVEETNAAGGTCATFDISYAFTGTPA
jgi:hypothetical protein